MGKLTQTNQFNGGIIKDLHPIMTPNTVLTDCLNGTLLTYNGNEFVLQNDMGNYAFTNGSLSKNFVPVGLKEFGGLLYIISYNPIDNKIEIGTFPSQQTIWNSKASQNNATLSTIKLNPKVEKILYTDINTDIVLLSNNKDSQFYLSPGDKYVLTYNEEEKEAYENSLSWQHLTLYALTDENKLYNITGYINFKPKANIELPDDYTPIGWEIPGWLAAKFEVNTPTEFSAYFDSKNTIAEEIDDGTYKVVTSGILKLKTIWDTTTYNKDQIDSIKQNICYIFHNKEANFEDSFEIFTPEENTELSYNTIQTILHTSLNDTKNYNFVTPALKVGEQYIVYNQFTTSISQSYYIIDPKNIKLGEDYFKYYTDQKSMTLYFDYASYPGVVLAFQLFRYKDDRYSDDTEWGKVNVPNVSSLEINKETYYSWSDINYNGVNIIDLTFTPTNITDNDFDKEDIYLIKFSYFINTKNGYIKISSSEFPLYVSEVTNYYYNIYNNYNNFTAEDWAGNASLGLAIHAPSAASILDKLPENIVAVQAVGDTKFKEFKSFAETQTNVETYYGKGFSEIPSEVNTAGLGYYKVINRYKFQEKGGKPFFELDPPKNQYGNIGRLWKDTYLCSISSNCAIMDTLNKSHPISSNSETNNILDSDIYLDIADVYKLNVTTTPLQKLLADENTSVRLCEIANNDPENYLNSATKVVYKGEVSDIIQIQGFLSQRVFSERLLEQICYWEPYDTLYCTFVDNILYFTHGGSENLEKIADGKADEKTLEEYKFKSIEEMPYASESRYILKYNIKNHAMKDGDGWSSTTPSIANMVNNIQLIRCFSDYGLNCYVEGVGEVGHVLTGLYINSTNKSGPYFLFMNNDLVDERNCFKYQRLLLAAILYYVKYAKTILEKMYYFPTISINQIPFNTFTTKSINVSGTFSWHYLYTQDNDPSAALLGSYIESISNTFALEGNNTIVSKIPITYTLYLYDQEDTLFLLENFSTEINSKSNDLYIKYSAKDNVNADSFYLDNSYIEEDNMIKLSKLVSVLQYYNSDKLLIPEDNMYYNGNKVRLKYRANDGTKYWVYVAHACNIYFD